jgi:ZIP family zinc transporter
MNVIVMSLLAGAIGMGFGGLLTAFLGSRTDKMISIFLSFAGGVMISIVFLELIPKASMFSNIGVMIIGLALGVLMVLVLNNVMDKVSNTKKVKSKLHETYAEYFHSSEMLANKKNMLRSGMIMLFAIALHNIPEGLAIGAAGQHDAALGLTLALMIGFHNIPEGMAISAPLISGGLSKSKAVSLTLITGATTVVGAIAGVVIGSASDLALALSLSMAGVHTGHVSNRSHKHSSGF